MQAAEKLLKSGEIKLVNCEGQEYYISNSENIFSLKDQVQIISPFDNLIINRQRAEQIFGSKYRLECYLPSQKRRYGFFALPLLYQDRFFGLIDLKADRKNKILKISNLHYYQKPSKMVKKLLETELQNFAGFNNCKDIEGRI